MSVNPLRALIRDYRILVILLMACALAVKALVPQGYMIGGGQKLLSVQLCLDGITHKSVTIALPAKGTGDDKGKGAPAPATEHCAFTALSMDALGGADAPLLAIALAFILAAGLAPLYSVLRDSKAYLRPPLRGPPLTA